MKRFLEWQGLQVKLKIIYLDNTTIINLEENVKGSLGKLTRHLDIQYFYVTELVSRKELNI